MKKHNNKIWLIFYFLCMSNAYAEKSQTEEIKNSDYIVVEDVKFFNYEKEIDSKAGDFYFQFNDGYDESGNDLLKLTVTQVIKQNKAGKMLTALPTVFLVPGGGFTSVLPSVILVMQTIAQVRV